MTFPPCNFRPIYLDSNLRKSNIYRSNSVNDKVYDNVSWLRETIGIKTIIDMRDNKEISNQSKFDDFYVDQKFNRKRFHSNGPDPNLKEFGQRYHFTFLTVYFVVKIIFMNMKLKEICKFLLLLIQHLFYFDYKFFKYMVNTVSRKLKLGKIYCLFLDNFQTNFKEIFTLMTEKENFPVLIMCQFGKDRTGIVSALVMDLMGSKHEWIMEEYMKSEVNLLPVEHHLKQCYKILNVDEEFIRTKPETMQRFLDYLKDRYGGAKGYLKECGMTDGQIDQIKRNIIGPL